MIRNINFEGIRNARDPGGIINREGRAVRPRCFIRSASLSKASDADIRLLKEEYSLETVIDLRTHTERAEKPDRLPDGVGYYHFPLFDDSALGVTWEKGLKARRMLSNLPDMCALYRHIVTNEESVRQLRAEFELIINHKGNGALLWHCSEGKDRCGITAALVLTMLDVDREVIFEDYLHSNLNAIRKARGFFWLVIVLAGGLEKARYVRTLFLAERAYLQSAFEAMEESCGSVEGFIREKLNIDDEAKEKFKERFLL